jgi:hypothetical protein
MKNITVFRKKREDNGKTRVLHERSDSTGEKSTQA